MLVHNINTDSLLLVMIDAIFFGDGGESRKILIGNFFIRVVKGSEQVSVLLMFLVDKLEQIELCQGVLQQVKHLFDYGDVVFSAYGRRPF